ncbi:MULTISPECIES: hypothetical protein [Nostoc]|nr:MULTISPECIES: hypothetical protein [Nostoc]
MKQNSGISHQNFLACILSQVLIPLGSKLQMADRFLSDAIASI